MSFALAILLALLPQTSGPKQETGVSGPPRGQISGRFVSAQTGEPLKGVSVQISAMLEGHFWRQATLSGVDGVFSFQGLAAGSYFVEGQKSGYRSRAGAGPITIEANQSRTGIEIKLDRAAVITGRVSGPEGLPVVGANVTAYRYRWSNGRRRAMAADSARTDDRGIYRLFGLASGRYVVAASVSPEEAPAGEADLSLSKIYYPAATQPSEAANLEVRWGQELSEINLVFRRQPSFAIAGVVADAETGGPCRSCTVSAAGLDEAYGFSNRQFPVAPDGSYRIRGLIPGSYRILAVKAVGNRHAVSAKTVQLGNRSLRDVHLVVGAGRAVSGRVVLESPPDDRPASETQVVFVLDRAEAGNQVCRVRPDLSFETDALAAETYRLLVRGLPAGGYLRALRLAGRELPGPELEVPEEGSLTDVELVVAFDSATLSGQVKPSEGAGRGHRVTAAVILLVPQDNQSPFLTERRANTGSSGSFTVSGVAPGAYHVFAFPQTDTAEWEDPSIRRRRQNYGKSIDLGRREKKTIELVLAPETVE